MCYTFLSSTMSSFDNNVIGYKVYIVWTCFKIIQNFDVFVGPITAYAGFKTLGTW